MVSEKKWYHSSSLIVLLLVFFWPVGLILTWINPKWSNEVKGIITAVIGSMAIVGMLIFLLAVATFVDTADKVVNETPTKSTETAKTPTETTTEKPQKPQIFELGQAQNGEYWKYVPKKIKRAASITGDFGSSKPAGKGQEFLLLYITIQNITNETQHSDFTFDPQPVILSGNQEYKFDSSNSYSMKDSERFEESEDIAPGGTQSGWLLFKIPAGKKGLKLQIEDFVWGLGI